MSTGFCRVGFAENLVPPVTKAEFEALEERVEDGELETAIFAGGCFWCTESYFIEEPGVLGVQSGYTGGRVENPTYEKVSTKLTGHAEAVQVIYDPKITSYAKMLDVFFESHDPTQLNRQGPDEGPQYRSAVFYVNDKQKEAAMKKFKDVDASGEYTNKVVTELNLFKKFYRAEEYHQRYYIDRGVDKEKLKEWKGK